MALEMLMRSVRVPSLVWPALFFVLFAVFAADATATRIGLDESYARLPMIFEPNVGQANIRGAFLARGAGYRVEVDTQGIRMLLRSTHSIGGKTANAVLGLRFIDARSDIAIDGQDALASTSNYFIGADPSGHRTSVPNFAKVRAAQIYDGVDVIYYGNQRQLEYDLVVAPGADLAKLRLAIDGADGVSINHAGDLVLQVGWAEVVQHKPRVFQEIGHQPISLDARYVMHDSSVGFEVTGYDSSKTLVIDPVLSYSSYLGGTGTDYANAVAVDSAGNAYIVGSTDSSGFPGLNGFDRQIGSGDNDAFVTKVNPTGTAIVYSTYLGGSKGADWANAVAVDASGNAFVTGTAGTGFPVTTGAYQTTFSGSASFVTKLNASGTALIYSTYVNGTIFNAVRTDTSGNAFATGYGNAFTTTAGAYQRSLIGGPTANDVTVLKINPSGTAALLATYLGVGTANAMAIDPQGNVYVGGSAGQNASPLCTNGSSFLYKLSADFSSLIYSTCPSPNSSSAVNGLALDQDGNVHFTGRMGSGNTLPVVNAFQTTPAAPFVGSIDPAGNYIYLSYIGGTTGLGDSAEAAATDPAGNGYFVGWAGSTDFPLLNNPPSFLDRRQGTYGVWVAKVSSSGHHYYTVLISGSGGDRAYGIAVDSNSGVYVAGQTDSTDFPVTAGVFQGTRAYDPRKGATADAFIFKLGSPAYSVSLSTSANNIAANQSTTLSTSVSGPSNPVTGNVLLYDGGVSIASLTLSNGAASSVFTNLAVGLRRLTAIYDANGDGSSSRVVLQGVNQAPCNGTAPPQPVSGNAPIVVLTAPSNCQTMASAGALGITAEAGSSVGAITGVQFFVNGSSIGTVTKPPYTTTWTPPGMGTFSITATATATGGLSTTSAPIVVTVDLPPTVALTSPSANATYRVGSSVPLAATATDTDGIRTVEFLVGNDVVPASANPPYTATWTASTLGSYTVAARATDNLGASATSSSVTIGVVANLPPQVTITSPTNGAIVPTGDITIQATATDDRAVASVDFYSGGLLINTVPGPGPAFSTVWRNVLPGTYGLTAKATDDQGATTTSSAVSITVNGTGGAIDAPQDGQSFYAPAQIAISYRASTSAGVVHTVDFQDNGAVFFTLTWDSSNSVSGTLNVSNVPVGTHVFTLKVTPSTGATGTSPAVSVNVASAPTVNLTSPLSNEFYIAPAFVRLAGTPTNLGAITKAEFLSNGTVIGTVTSAPYEYVWTSVPVGTYGVAVRFTDVNGVQAVSPATTIVVGTTPSVTVDSSIPGSTVNDVYLSVRGTAQLPANGGIAVNNIPAIVDITGSWYADNVPLQPGANTVTVAASSLDAQTVTTSFTVTSSGRLPFALLIDPQDGFSPFDSYLTFFMTTPTEFSRIDFDLNSDGTADSSITSLDETGRYEMHLQTTGAGAFPVTVRVYSQGNAIYTATRTIYARPADVATSILTEEYAGAMARLKVGDIDGALRRFSDAQQSKYRNVFNFLGARLPSAVDGLGLLMNPVLDDDLIEFSLVRGATAFPLRFVRGGDGVWRIDGM